MAAAVESDGAIAVVGQEEHLVLPVGAAQGPAVGEDDGQGVGGAPV